MGLVGTARPPGIGNNVSTGYINNVHRHVPIVNIQRYIWLMGETYHHGNLRHALIHTGLKLLNRDGVVAFSLRKLSGELGVSHAAAYRHFPSKEALLHAILDETSEMFRKAIAQAIPPDTDGIEALLQLGVGYVHFFVDNPEILAFFNLVPSEKGAVAAALGLSGLELESSSKSPGAFDVFRTAALATRNFPQFINLEEREILLGYWSKVHGLATLLTTHPQFIPKDAIGATVDRIVRTPF